MKVLGAAFLGTARSEHASHAYESGPSMMGPMGALAACCFFIGLAPTCIAPALSSAVSVWAPEVTDMGPRLTALAPLGWVSVMAVALVAMLALTSLLLWLRLKASVVETGPTWGCGFTAPTPRIQYTSSSFAEMLVGLFGWALRPRVHRAKVTALLPQPTDFHSHVPDPVLDEFVLPAFHFTARLFSWFRIFQQGKIQAYLLYIFVALVALLLWH